MKKTFMTAILAGLMAVSMSMTAFAGQWQQDAKGWWYQNDDKTYLKDGWKWVDGKCYYFTSDGYCLTGTQTQMCIRDRTCCGSRAESTA